jgi:hypothetical protein
MSMKKIILALIVLTVLISPAFPSLIDLYKKGTIKLEQTSDFGKKTDWESLFYQPNKCMTITPDGTIFVAPGEQDNIFKFDSTGRHIGTYGQRGEGKGDLRGPSRISILDGKYLVIEEFSPFRRISVFDFNGKCIKILKTDHSAAFQLALKNNKIVYQNTDTTPFTKTGKFKETIFIKDFDSGKEFPVFSCEILIKNVMISGEYMWSVTENNEFGEMVFCRTADGNLVVGVSNTPDIQVYSPEGKFLRTFKLQMKPIPITGDYIKRFKNYYMSNLKADIPPASPRFIKKMEKVSFDQFFFFHASLLPGNPGR